MHFEVEQEIGTGTAGTEAAHGNRGKKKPSQQKLALGMRAKKKTAGITVDRLFTKEGVHPYDEVRWEKRRTVISNPDGSIVFQMDDAEVPEFWSQLATDIVASKYFRKAGVPLTGRETSVKQLVRRVAHSIRLGGEKFKGYFKTSADAEAFEMELTHLLVHQKLAFNSPVWFNCGLWHEYKIEGSGGNFFWNPTTDKIDETANAYEYPQCSACFIQSVSDDLMSIFDLARNEARIFKYGSGTGSNFSKIRGNMEKLSGGGLSSGLMSFLEVLDRGAGATKSGGTTRRAAKMCILDIDHPEIEDFINWKVREEKKVAALIDAGYSNDFNGEAYRTVAGQNSNNSVRITDEFMKAVEEDKNWDTRLRTSGEVYKTYKAKDLWNQIAFAAWACADPGIQYDSTINDWHTSPNTDRINGSNPCSEYMFLDDSACNLASVNLLKFLDAEGNFDIEGYRHACQISTIAQEILVDFSSYPIKKIAQNSHDYRPLGLGYANLGTLLMVKGIPYDSPEGQAWAGALTAIMTGTAYATSAMMAKQKGPFPGYEKNREPMLRVMRKHRAAVDKISAQHVPAALLEGARDDWDLALSLGERYGYRNAQATVLAPTGTIGLLMDCDTTGIEPDFALVKFKKLAGGGYFKIVNQSLPAALKNLGYGEHEAGAIIEYAMGTLRLRGAPNVNDVALKAKGLTADELAKVEKALPTVFTLEQAFGTHILGEATMKRLGFGDKLAVKGFSLLRELGFSAEQIEQANEVICGRMSIEGAPYLKEEHLAVFDCANRCGKKGTRYIAPMGHIRMMAAAQPFLSGAISKTVNLPHEATVEEIGNLYKEGWKLGLKAIALYRDGCKLSQPLSTNKKKEEKKAEPAPQPVAAAAAPAPQIIQVVAPARKRMPRKRGGFTVEAKIASHKVYLRTGEYEDGTLGEIFIDMHKEGATFRSLLNCFAISVSLGLQHGVPLEEFVDVFTFTRFEPQGMVDHPNIKSATSVVDFIFRVLGMEYLKRTDFVHVKPDDLITTATASNGKAKPEPIQSVTEQQAAAVAAQASAQTPAQADEDDSQVSMFSAENDKRPSKSLGVANGTNILSKHLQDMMGDAPFCSQCGHTTIRNGACYKCLNCGNSMGCS